MKKRLWSEVKWTVKNTGEINAISKRGTWRIDIIKPRRDRNEKQRLPAARSSLACCPPEKDFTILSYGATNCTSDNTLATRLSIPAAINPKLHLISSLFCFILIFTSFAVQSEFKIISSYGRTSYLIRSVTLLNWCNMHNKFQQLNYVANHS